MTLAELMKMLVKKMNGKDIDFEEVLKTCKTKEEFIEKVNELLDN